MSLPPTAIHIGGSRQIADLIRTARSRLVVVAPAVTLDVAEAISAQWRTLPPGTVSIIVDSDPEVYRLGFGTEAALELLVATGAELGDVVRRQPGIRIGIIIADNHTLIYAPTPELIEAGPNTRGSTNAILLGQPPAGLEHDIVPTDGEPRIGRAVLSEGEFDRIKKDLDDNPPQKFDIARRMNVFNSYFEFVELELTGVHIDRKRIQIPTHLLGVADPKTQEQISSHFQLVPERSVLSGEALRKDRDLLARKFLTVIPNYGTVVRRSKKPELAAEVQELQQAVAKFREKLRAELQDAMDKSRGELVKALLPGVQRNPPKDWRFSDGRKPDKDTCKQFLDEELTQAFGAADRLIAGMTVRLTFKGVTYEMLKDETFLAAAAKAGLDVKMMHEELQAAPAEKPTNSLF